MSAAGELDDQAERLLKIAGKTSASIPKPGEQVFLRATGNLSTGGTAIDLTDVVHFDNCEMAIQIGRAHV